MHTLSMRDILSTGIANASTRGPLLENYSQTEAQTDAWALQSITYFAYILRAAADPCSDTTAHVLDARNARESRPKCILPEVSPHPPLGKRRKRAHSGPYYAHRFFSKSPPEAKGYECFMRCLGSARRGRPSPPNLGECLSGTYVFPDTPPRAPVWKGVETLSILSTSPWSARGVRRLPLGISIDIPNGLTTDQPHATTFAITSPEVGTL